MRRVFGVSLFSTALFVMCGEAMADRSDGEEKTLIKTKKNKLL
jgi:hypothetical protein